ncbi:MAG: hypothetical protein ACREDS_04625, partial [Limisphaerales bacterium]
MNSRQKSFRVISCVPWFQKMIHGIHIEVLLAGGYSLLLAGVAAILEIVARHSHRRSEHFRNSGFTYKKKMDVWECPTGHHLTR